MFLPHLYEIILPHIRQRSRRWRLWRSCPLLDEKVHLTVDRGDMRDIIHCNEMHIGNYVGQILPLPLRLKF